MTSKFAHYRASRAPGPLAIGFERSSKYLDRDETLRALLVEVQLYIEEISADHPGLESFGVTATDLRYRLLSWTVPSSLDEQSSAIQKALRVAMILFIESLLPRCAVRPIDHSFLLSRLKHCLSEFDVSATDGTELIIWMLFVGGITLGNCFQDWFLSKLVETMAPQSYSWDVVKRILLRFWWVESIHDNTGKIVLEQIRNIQDSTPADDPKAVVRSNCRN